MFRRKKKRDKSNYSIIHLEINGIVVRAEFIENNLYDARASSKIYLLPPLRRSLLR